MYRIIIILSLLFSFGCVKIKSSQFITFDYINCHSLESSFNKKQLSKIDKFDFTLDHCAIMIENFKLRKNLIRSFTTHYYVNIEKYDHNDEDPSGPLKIISYNNENCEIETEYTRLWINSSCKLVEDKLND